MKAYYEVMSKTAAANITEGMIIRPVALETIDPNGIWGFLAAKGETHLVPLGSVTATSPTVTVASVDASPQRIKNNRSVLVTTTEGHVFSISTRQKVEVV